MINLSVAAASSDPLLQPLQIDYLSLKNRVFSSSHAPGYNTDGTPSERYVAYHEEKARGGIGLTMIGGSSNVAIDSASLWGQLDFSNAAIVEPLGRMVERVHAQGAAIMCQLTHMGRRNVSHDGDWLPTIGPSSVREPMHRGWPKEMEKADFRRVAKDFAAAALRAQMAGLDGVELCATSHLVDQFWTPLVNQRTDEYGGSLENRLRFTFEVLTAMRETTGGGLLMGIRMIADEGLPGGLLPQESKEIAQRIAASGLVDFLNLASSSLATEAGLAKAIPPSGTPTAPYLGLVASIKNTVDVPVLHATRITDVATARHAVAEGFVDLVGMTRGHMADPHLVNKLAAGQEDRVRACVGASLCINRLHLGMDAVCIQNPATGRETFVPQLVTPSAGPRKKIVVVGAGPGGLEAARVCAERGHQVVLFEAQDRVGGQVVVAARASERQAELMGVIGWLAAEVDLLGVEVRLNTPAEIAEVQAENPEVVIAATGGWPGVGSIEYGEDLLCTSVDVLSGQVVPIGRVLIFDDHGSERGPSIAEFLVNRGVDDVELVTPDRLVAHDLSATLGPAYLTMLYGRGVKMATDLRLVGVRKEGQGLKASLRNEFTGQSEQREVDTVIVEHGSLPNDGLWRALTGESNNDGVTDLAALAKGKAQPLGNEGFALFRIGDAVASRDIAAAIFEARRLCQNL